MSAILEDITARLALTLSDLVAAASKFEPADGKAIAAWTKFAQDEQRRRLKGELDRARNLLAAYYKRR